MVSPFERKKHRLGLFYGLVAGVAFSFFAWGLDAIKLANAHVAYPFVKFLPALFICAAVGSLIGWLSIRIGHWLVTIVLWLGFAVMSLWLVIWLPIEFSAQFLSWRFPIISTWVQYPIVDQVQQFQIIGMIVIGVPVLIIAVLENIIVEQALAAAAGGLLTIGLVCTLLMGGAGLGADELLNRQFREPVQTLDNLFSFAIENEGKVVDKTIARRMHLSAVEDIMGLLSDDGRKIILIGYDSMLGQMDYLVDFHGTWVRCTTIYSQPTDCELVKELTHKYYSAPALCFSKVALPKNTFLCKLRSGI